MDGQEAEEVMLVETAEMVDTAVAAAEEVDTVGRGGSWRERRARRMSWGGWW